MNEGEIRRILEQVNEETLARMRSEGFCYQGRKRHDPLVWDVNNGWCEEWADRAAELLPGSYTEDFIPGYSPGGDSGHTWLVYGGRHYDAECLGGVTDPARLPFFAVLQVPRPEP